MPDSLSGKQPEEDTDRQRDDRHRDDPQRDDPHNDDLPRDERLRDSRQLEPSPEQDDDHGEYYKKLIRPDLDSDGPSPWSEDLLEAKGTHEASSSWNFGQGSESVNGLPDQLPILLASKQLPTISLSAAASTGERVQSFRSPASESRPESETVETNTASETVTMSQTLNLSSASETITMNPTLNVSPEESVPAYALDGNTPVRVPVYATTFHYHEGKKVLAQQREGHPLVIVREKPDGRDRRSWYPEWYRTRSYR